MHKLILLPLLGLAAVTAACTSGNTADLAQNIRPVLAQKVAALDGAGGTSVYSGEIRARREADLGFRLPGKIVSRSVDMGASVKRGQVLARIDPTDTQMNADAARAATAAAKTDFQFASAEADRYKSLFEKGFVSRTVLDQKTAALDSARARLDQAEAQANVSHNQIGYTTLVADQDGVITAVLAEAGQVVAAGQPVVRLARPEEKEVLISIPESRLAQTRQATFVAIRLWADPSKVYQGRVRELAPSADPVTRSFAARISIPTADSAVALGMTANVVFANASGAEQSADSTVLIPLTALSRQGDQPAVWVISSAGQAALRPIQVKQYREDGIVVSQGLTPGEIIAVAGVHKLVPGQTVRPIFSDGTTNKTAAASTQGITLVSR
jgi:RND family efflux transporter MFP subunit